MTEYIGDIPISSVQNIQISKSKESSEFDLVDGNSNIILEGSEEAEQIQIDFTLLKETHPEELDIENQRSELKSLISNNVIDNSFEYEGKEYFLSIGNVSIPEDSNLQLVREGTITAQAMPWPKNYPDADLGRRVRSSGELLFVMDLSSEPQIVSVFPSGEADYELDVEALTSFLLSSSSAIEYSLDVESEPNEVHSINSQVDYSLDFVNTIADMKRSSVGVVQFGLNINPDFSLLKNAESNVDYSIDVVGSFDGSIHGFFGRTFGRNFGGN